MFEQVRLAWNVTPLKEYTFGNVGETTIHPLVIVVFVIASACMFVCSKRNIATIFLVLSLLIPLDSKVIISGFNIYSIRILIFVSWASLLLTSRMKIARFTSLDKIFVTWAIAKVIIFVLLWQSMASFINMMGFLVTTFGIYFIFRMLITSIEDIEALLKVLVGISILIASCMVFEKLNGRNLFAFISGGGVPMFTLMREGNLRCQGPFQHPICAGMFGATLLPLFAVKWYSGQKKDKLFWMVGILAVSIIIFTSASSGPVLTGLAGVVGLLLWRYRAYTRLFRWATVLILVSLHMVMKAPVWALIGRVGVVGGSTGYHRVELVDRFIRYFDEWWLLGTTDTMHWGYGMQDRINQFVMEGVQGGLLGFILFISLLVICFKIIGRSLKATEERPHQLFIWGIGATLFGQMAGFFGISYWDQQLVIWYLLLAMISTLACVYLETAAFKTGKIKGKQKIRFNIVNRYA